MRSRMSALVLSLVLAAAFTACNKQQSQTQNPPPTTDNSMAQNQPPASDGQMQSAPTQSQQQQMAPAPAQQQQQMAPTPPPPPPPPPPLVIPAGASLVVRMGNTINTKTANTGDSFTGTLAQSVAVDGVVAIPSGAGVAGTVVDSKSPGRFKGEGTLSVALTSINVRGVPTTISSSTYTQTVKGKGKRTAVMAGGGTGAGALIGGLAGGGKGALIGGLVGAGAGTAGAAFTGNKELQIPAESVVTFKLGNSITVKRSNKSSSSDSQ
jgi:glucose/arabinose dehydrogenase